MNGVDGRGLFETTLGRRGIAWNARGITAVQLPMSATRRRGDTATVARMRLPAVPMGSGNTLSAVMGLAVTTSGWPPHAVCAVGQALGHNRFAPVVPCHRVLGAGARSGGFSAEGGVQTKLRMLLIEKAAFGAPGLFDWSGKFRRPLFNERAHCLLVIGCLVRDRLVAGR